VIRTCPQPISPNSRTNSAAAILNLSDAEPTRSASSSTYSRLRGELFFIIDGDLLAALNRRDLKTAARKYRAKWAK
jgi:hypothetical protein